MKKTLVPATLFALVTTLLLLAGCTTRHIREAQREFDAGAALEFGDTSTAAGLEAFPGPEGAAAVHYRAAYDLVVKEQAENAEALRQDKLLGTARMLELLAGWRLSDLDDDATLRDAVSQRITASRGALRADPPGLALGTRDRVLLAALPGLIDHDRGRDQATFADVNRYFESAYATLDDALTTENPPALHPVRIWVRLAQLNTCKAWSSTLETPGVATAAERNGQAPKITAKWAASAKALVPFLPGYPALGPLLNRKAAEFGADLSGLGIVVDATSGEERPRHLAEPRSVWLRATGSARLLDAAGAPGGR